MSQYSFIIDRFEYHLKDLDCCLCLYTKKKSKACKRYGVSTEKFAFIEVDKVFDNIDTKQMKAEFQNIRDTFADISGKMNKQLETLQKPARNNEAR